MDSRDMWLSILGLATAFALVCSSLYGCYWLGRRLERRDLTKSLIESISTTYNEGLEDGLKTGYSKGWKEALATCDDLVTTENSKGRY